MLMTKNRSRPATPVRPRSPHSMMMAASNGPSMRCAILISGTPGNCISGPGAGSEFTTTTSLPSVRSAYAMASCDPIESPSGRECDETTNRWRARTSWTIRRISGVTALGVGLVIVIVWIVRVDFVEQLFDAVLARDRFIVEELQLGDAPQPEAGSNLAPQERRRAVQRPLRVPARVLLAERGVEDARLLQIGVDLHARDRYESDSRVVDLARDQHAELAADLIGDQTVS